MSYGVKDVVKDVVTGGIRIASKDVQNDRLKVCYTCPDLKAKVKVCSICGCYVPGKVKFSQSTCPKGRW